MSEFRYAQFCPVARAAELLGHRWNLLILRELLVGPQRFSDLGRRLAGVSSSVLTERLSQLEEKGIVAKRTLDPPAASIIYELTQAGRAIEPAFLELTRWGMRFMGSPEPEDQFEVDWIPLGLKAVARPDAAPAHSLSIHVADDQRKVVVQVTGGPGGTQIEVAERDADAVIHTGPIPLLGVASGQLPLDQAVAAKIVSVEGDAAALAALPSFFVFPDQNNQPDDQGA